MRAARTVAAETILARCAPDTAYSWSVGPAVETTGAQRARHWHRPCHLTDREAFDLLLMDMENHEARLPPERVDSGRFRNELGLNP